MDLIVTIGVWTMRNIFLCENQLSEIQHYEQFIKFQLETNQFPALTYSFGTENSEELLLYVKNHPLETGLYFLGIKAGDGQLNAIQLAEQIRQSDPQALIVFLAQQEKLSFKAVQHHIEPLDYIIKTTDHQKEYAQILLDLQIAQQRDRNIPDNTSEIFTYKLESSIYKLNIQKIDYFKTTDLPHKLQLTTSSQRVEIRGDLNEIQARHPVLFRGHKGVLLNPKRIKSIDLQTRLVTFVDDERCQIAYRRLADLKRVL